MEYNGFLWNKCSGVRLESAGLMESEGTPRDDRLFVRMPFVGKFAVSAHVRPLLGFHPGFLSWMEGRL